MAESSQSTSSASYSRFSSSSTSFAAETPETVSDCEVDSGVHKVRYVHTMLYNHFFGGIIGQKLENNGYTFWEVWNRIMGTNLSIIASCLMAVSALWLIQSRSPRAQPRGRGLYKP